MISLSRKARTLKSEKLTFYSRSCLAVIRVYDEGGNVIETHDHAGDSKSGKFIHAYAICGCQLVRSGARPTMHGAKRLSLLVCTLVCLRARFFRTA